jgi:NAD(P)-dependent dehydrogenase (short-subunit alcohol dehydrogenase family)
MSGWKAVALITGSSRGIGRAIAEKLAQDHCAVVVNFVSRPDAAHEAVKSIEGAGGAAIAVQGNVGIAEDRQRLVEAAMQQWGRLDVLVNNAGITSPGRVDLLEATPENWDRVLDTNLKGPFFLSQLAAKTMIQQRQAGSIESGHIVNISSVSAYAVSTNRADYCVAKAGMQMMTWLFADRLAEFDIGVFEICPGVIESDMTAPVKEKYDRLIAEGLTPIRRWGKPQDIALAVSAIVQGSFPFSTGERINVDGGFHMRKL